MTRSRNRLFVALAVAVALASSAFTGIAATESGPDFIAGSCCLKQ